MMKRTELGEVREWVFDLDDTLYAAGSGVFQQVSDRITDFVMQALDLARGEAEALRTRYYREHGTTLAGLMARHGTDPDPFLAYVHDVDLSALAPDPALAEAISALPGRKIVHTNGSRRHAENVVAALELGGCFEALYGVEDADYDPKPQPAAHARVLEAAGVRPARAAMIEDSVRNLEEPARLGMATLWLRPGTPETPAHVDHAGADLVEMLRRVI